MHGATCTVRNHHQTTRYLRWRDTSDGGTIPRHRISEEVSTSSGWEDVCSASAALYAPPRPEIPQVEGYLRWRDTIPQPGYQEVGIPRQQDGRMYARCNLHCTIYYLLPQVEGYHPEVQDTQR